MANPYNLVDYMPCDLHPGRPPQTRVNISEFQS